MKFEIAKQKDFDGWMKLLELVSESFPGLDIEDYKTYLHNSIENQCALICRDQDAIAGAASISQDHKEIEFLAVHPDHRRKGIGKALIDYILDRLPPGSRITVITYRENDESGKAARKLYESLGFQPGKLLTVFDYPCQEFEYIKA